MNAKELAKQLNGCEYREETFNEKEAEENNLVVVFGASDDLMEFKGAINDEIDCYNGGVAYLRNGDTMSNECDECCPYYDEQIQMADTIQAVWAPTTENYSWIYETSIPHETFDVMEDGEPYCRGIVFSLDDINAK